MKIKTIFREVLAWGTVLILIPAISLIFFEIWIGEKFTKKEESNEK